MQVVKYLLIGFTFLLVGLLIGCHLGLQQGEDSAYETIVTGECWLDEQTRDIECTKYIGK